MKHFEQKIANSEDIVYPLFNFVLYDLSKNKPFTSDSIMFMGERELSQIEKKKNKTKKREKIAIYKKKSPKLGEYYTTQLQKKYDKYYIIIEGKEHHINFKLSKKFYTECCGLHKYIKQTYLDEILLEELSESIFEIDLILGNATDSEFSENDIIIAE